MKKGRYDFSGTVADRVEKLMREAKTPEALRRHQVSYFRARYGDTAQHIANRTGWAVQTGRNLHSAWRRHGEAALALKPKGGRFREHLTPAQERALIEGHRQHAAQGGILEVSRIQKAYERAVGAPIAQSTTYRMLHRHGWRKIAPRPRHPKADPVAQEAFKKTGPTF